MKGIQFLVDSEGNKTAVQIGLENLEENWEDVQDILVSLSRLNEPRVKWDDIKKEMDEFADEKV